jgi:hypothetical protein
MAANDEAVRALRMRVQVAWENAMDNFYERLDDIYAGSTEIEEADVIDAVRQQIDDETADSYEDWIG